MACGLHVLANDVGDNVRSLATRLYLFITGSKIVAKQIRSIFANRDQAVKLADPRQRILTSFPCNAMVDAYASLYQKEIWIMSVNSNLKQLKSWLYRLRGPTFN